MWAATSTTLGSRRKNQLTGDVASYVFGYQSSGVTAAVVLSLKTYGYAVANET